MKKATLLLILVFGMVFATQTNAETNPLGNDALIAPDRVAAMQNGAYSAPRIFPQSAPYGAGFYDTSEYMLGKISIAVILPQCDGGVDTCTEQWDAVREADVYNRIQIGMTWLANQEPNANISFVWHLYSGRTDARAKTSYEPITRSTYEDAQGFNLWMTEIMKKFGYETGDYFNQTRAFINDMIAYDNTDWGYMLFIADSLNDTDGAFSTGRVAAGYYGGPFAFGTYDNGGYTISGMDFIAAHESAHVFYATDEYQYPLEQSGYLGAYDNDGSGCFMDLANSWCISQGSREQLGWRDSDGDGIVDILDTEPAATLNQFGKSTSKSPTYTGSANVNPLPNQNPIYTNGSSQKNNISINTIANAQYRVNGGAWQDALAQDGNFSSGEENFQLTLSNLSRGSYLIEGRAKNNQSLWASSYAQYTAQILEPWIIISPNKGKKGLLKLFNSQGKMKSHFYPYGKKYNKGLEITAGDLSGDNESETITITKKGAIPQVKIFNSQGQTVLKKKFYPYGKKRDTSTCETFIASGDINRNGTDEILTALNCRPEVRVFNKNGKKVYSFKPFKNGNGNLVAADFDGDYQDEVAVVSASASKPLVKIYKLVNNKFKLKKKFYAYQKNRKIKMNLTAGDINNDGKAEIIVAPAKEFLEPVKIFNQNGKRLKKNSLYPFGKSFTYGINLASIDFNEDGYAEVLFSKEMGYNNKVKIYSWKGKKASLFKSFRPYAKGFWDGVNVGGGYF